MTVVQNETQFLNMIVGLGLVFVHCLGLTFCVFLVCYRLFVLVRSTALSRPNNIREGVQCPYVHKKFF